MRPLSKWSNVTQFDVTNGNEYQTATMTKIEMNQENFYFEHEKHPAKSNIKKEPNSAEVSKGAGVAIQKFKMTRKKYYLTTHTHYNFNFFQFKPLDYVKEENLESNQKSPSTYFHLQPNDTLEESECYNNAVLIDKPKICLVIKRLCKHEEYFTYFKDS